MNNSTQSFVFTNSYTYFTYPNYDLSSRMHFFDNGANLDIISSLDAINPSTTISLRGFFLICFNLLFKLTAAPFHF